MLAIHEKFWGIWFSYFFICFNTVFETTYRYVLYRIVELQLSWHF